MATVIFDFDSTLITCESLEHVLESKKLDEKAMQQIREITNQGMSGAISFLSSLERRLRVVLLRRQDFVEFGQRAVELITPGMRELVAELQQRSTDVWIVSGAAREAMLPVGKALGIPLERLLGVDLLWDADGCYAGIDADKPLNRSKWEGAQLVASLWTAPTISVGDGITDFALYEHGLVQHFIAFTQNVRRQAVLDKRVPEARTVAALRQQLQELIHGDTVTSKK